MTETTSHNSGAQPESTTPDPPSKRAIYLAMAGLMLGMLLAMLDNLIVSTALPTIVGDLGGLAHLSWVVTGYALAAAAATPIWGKLGDLYGRRIMYMSSIVIFLIGSALAGLSQNMDQLIAFRAIQGLGAGGLMVGAMAIIGDLIPPRDRGRYQALIGGMMPIAFVGGPLIGGVLTDDLSWRWVFYINLPLGVAALVVTGLFMHLPRHRIKARIDYIGAILLTVGVVSLTLAASWAGSEYAWGSWQIITLFVAAVVFLVGFVYAEGKVAEPILPPRLFRSRNFSVAQVLSFLVGAAMFGAVNFLPQYMQNVRGESATASGLLLLPLMFGMLVVMLGTGQITTRTGRYREFPIIGGALLTVGMLLLLMLNLNTTTLVASGLTLVVGLGMGFLMQNTMLITQNSVDLRDMGAASGSVTLFRSVGGSLGIAVLGSIYTTKLTDSLTSGLGAQGNKLISGGGAIPPSVVLRLPAPIREVFQSGVVAGLHGVLIGGAIMAALGFVVAWFIKAEPLRGGAAPTTSPEPAVVLGEPVLEDELVTVSSDSSVGASSASSSGSSSARSADGS
jgi:EmrB/QacA subfamily drug resistance transporter